jgi:serine/threonine protein kinase
MLPVQLKPGTVFGQDFEIQQRLAQGGMGTVYVAVQQSTGKKRALKIMHAQYEGDEQARRRFIQEARVGASIDSDHIVEMVGAGIDPDTNTPWIAMELLKGEDLKSVITSRRALPPEEVLEIFRQVCHALGKAHSMGLVHRDLKPENIFLAVPRREGVAFTAKILDFGIAKLVRENTGNSTQTQAIGSPRWMSPEQADRGGPISPATDVWALGLIAYALLTGKVYWRTAHIEAPSVIAQMCEVLMDPISSASERAEEQGVAHLLPEGFDAWFAQCVVREVSARFANANECLAALEPVLMGEEPIVLAPTRLRAPTPARGLSTRPPPVSANVTGAHAKQRYSLGTEVPTEQPFSLDAAPPREPTGPQPVYADAAPATKRTWVQRLGPLLLAAAGPLGIALAVLIGIRRNNDTRAAVHDAGLVPMAVTDVGVPPAMAVPDVPPVIPRVVTVDVLVQAPPPVVVPTPSHGRDAGTRGDSGRNRTSGNNNSPQTNPTEMRLLSSEEYTNRVLSQIRARYPQFVRCYEEQGTPTPGARLSVSLHFSIRPDGRPAEVGTSGSGVPSELGRCITDIVQEMTLPTPVAVVGPIFHELHFRATTQEPEAPAPPANTGAPAPSP